MKSRHSKCSFALSTRKSEINFNDLDVFRKPAQTFSNKPRSFILCEKQCITDGRPEGRIAPRDKLDVKPELPLSLNFDCSVLLVFSRLFFCVFLYFPVVLRFSIAIHIRIHHHFASFF